jgi:multidrug efflux pump subunit AcrA (membrane-fusion protein)
MRNHLSAIIISLSGAVWLAACTSASPPAAPANRPVPATLLTAAYETVPEYVSAPGSVQPRNRILLSAQVNGFVREVRVRAGDVVRSGQILATLDAREADSQKAAASAAMEEAQAVLAEAQKSAETAARMRDAAKASAELADATLARYRKLFDARSATPQELDEVKARRDAAAADLAAKESMVAAAQDRLRQVSSRIAQAKAQAARADVVVGWTVVTAPSAARVAVRQVDPGSAIFPGGPLLVLESTADPQILAGIPTDQSQYLRTGLEVLIYDESDSASPRTGRVSEIVPLSDPASHTVQFKVDFPAGSSETPGRFVRVSVPKGTRQALLVPREALRTMGQLTGIFVPDQSSTARLRLVKAAPFDSARFEILSGVMPGEKLVARAGGEIIDGTPLEVRQ